MLQIMGGKYRRSLLRNARVKYEWCINASSNSHSCKGHTRSKKVTIYIQDGVVERVCPNNV